MFVRGHWKAYVTMSAVTARVDNRTEHSSPKGREHPRGRYGSVSRSTFNVR